MALISAGVGPTDEIEVFDIPNQNGHIAGFRVDDISVYLGGHPLPEDKDAAIVATADLLIDKLVGLRDAAAGRIWDAERAALDAESPAEGHEVVSDWTRPEGVAS